MPRRDRKSGRPHSGDERGIPHAGRGPARPQLPSKAIASLLAAQTELNRAVLVASGETTKPVTPDTLTALSTAIEQIFDTNKAKGAAAFKKVFGVEASQLVADTAEGSAARAELFGDIKKRTAFHRTTGNHVSAKKQAILAANFAPRRVNRAPEG